MKKISKLLIIILYITKLTITQNSECILGIEVHPLTFIARRNTIELKLDLNSNCTDYPLNFFYILNYTKVYNISFNKHPRRVILDIKGRAYQLDFSTPKKKTVDGHENLIYDKVRLSPSEVPIRFKTTRRNNLILRTSKTNRFSKIEIDEIQAMENPIFCKMMKGNKTLVCKME